MSNQVHSLEEWWVRLGQLKNKEEMEGVAVILWELWKNRNDYVWKGNSCSAPVIVSTALSSLARWKLVRASSGSTSTA